MTVGLPPPSNRPGAGDPRRPANEQPRRRRSDRLDRTLAFGRCRSAPTSTVVDDRGAGERAEWATAGEGATGLGPRWRWCRTGHAEGRASGKPSPRDERVAMEPREIDHAHLTLVYDDHLEPLFPERTDAGGTCYRVGGSTQRNGQVLFDYRHNPGDDREQRHRRCDQHDPFVREGRRRLG